MTQNNEQDGKLTLRRPGRLELKKTVETGQVRQSFSHGRTKAVTVEVKKKRTFERGAGGNMRAVTDMPAPAVTPTEEQQLSTPDLGNLTEEERAARMRALRGAVQDEEQRQIAEAKDQKQQEAAAEEAKRLAEEEARKKAEEEASQEAASDPTPAEINGTALVVDTIISSAAQRAATSSKSL